MEFCTSPCRSARKTRIGKCEWSSNPYLLRWRKESGVDSFCQRPAASPTRHSFATSKASRNSRRSTVTYRNLAPLPSLHFAVDKCPEIECTDIGNADDEFMAKGSG